MATTLNSQAKHILYLNQSSFVRKYGDTVADARGRRRIGPAIFLTLIFLSLVLGAAFGAVIQEKDREIND
jgi:hypothetical protein